MAVCCVYVGICVKCVYTCRDHYAPMQTVIAVLHYHDANASDGERDWESE